MEDLPKFLHNSTILLDTNFLIHAFANKEVYAKFITSLKNVGVVFVAPNFVKYEFIRSKTIDVVRAREEYFYSVIENVLPYGEDIDKLIIPTIEEYKNKMEGLPLTDLVIATYLKRYKDLYLLTNDHGDFPTSVFSREYIFNIKDFGDKLYAIYAYKPFEDKLNESILDDEIPF